MLEKALSLHQKGKYTEAAYLYRKILAQNPKNADALHLLGLIEFQRKNLSAAIELIDRAITLSPNNAGFFSNRGNALKDLKRHDDALASYDRALSIKPDFAEALNNRGNVLKDLKRFDDALASYDRALAIKPDYAEALNNRGNALKDLKRFDEAFASYDRALAIKPDYAEALNNRGVVLNDLRRLDDALASYDRALSIKPDFAEALNNRGAVLMVYGKIGEAIACLRQAMAIKPDDAIIHTDLIFALNFDPSASAADKQFERAQWDKEHARRFVQHIRPHTNDPDQYRRLRVGYVTSHFRRQAATYSFGGVIINHDPKRFDVVCYSDTSEEDDVTARLRERADQWHHTLGLSDDQLSELIRSDRVDILVDLVGHMSGHRLGVFARKPAPIQVTAWGEPTGTGLKVMDYLLADSVLVPECERALLSERVVKLPNFLGYWTPEPLPVPGPLPALSQGHITFGSFNRLEKITDLTIRSWASILRQLPEARLVLKDRSLTDAGQRTRLEGAFVTEGISAGRLKLLADSDRASHFAAYQKIDIALDPFPHGGGMTTLDALWMGIPVLTWAGQTISSRLAAASLSALGLTDFIANAPNSYVDLAVAKATNLEALCQLRTNLRTQIAASEFGDCVRYSRAVEAVYREIWQRWTLDRTRQSGPTGP